jgi:hypothetical protein
VYSLASIRLQCFWMPRFYFQTSSVSSCTGNSLERKFFFIVEISSLHSSVLLIMSFEIHCFLALVSTYITKWLILSDTTFFIFSHCTSTYPLSHSNAPSFSFYNALSVFERMSIWGHAVTQWLRHCATNRKVADRFPMVSLEFFIWHNPSDRTMALESTQSLTEMSTRNISGG